MTVDLPTLEQKLASGRMTDELLAGLRQVHRNGLAYRKFPRIRTAIANLITPDSGAIAPNRWH